jgi:CDP-paratose 2-epimerase
VSNFAEGDIMRTTVVTGGAGFVGSNLVNSLLERGENVIVFDSLARAGSELNLLWLQSRHPGLQYVNGDVRDADGVRDALSVADVVYHLAGQVAVTTSVADPRTDFDVNAFGTFNVLEAARRSGRRPTLVFTSTNKVYGGIDDVVVAERATRYEFRDLAEGISESQPLDFHSPYGCSKGAADQYVRDYARIYDLPAVVFRMSCIYGPRQFGNEDQGWLAHFIIAAVLGRPISIYGDGKQVRDVLFVDDLVRAFHLATENIATARGQVYNIGGGSKNALAVWRDFAPILEGLTGNTPEVTFGDWRPGDQRCYVSDIRKAARDLGWSPQVDKRQGIGRLWEWVTLNRSMFEAIEAGGFAAVARTGVL